MPYFKATQGVELYYEDMGSGAPLVLIHGWPLSGAMWEYQVKPLVERGIRCITYDRRGFGRSDHPASGYDYDTFADDLKALLDHCDVHDVTLAGFSMGGGEVARYLGRHGSTRVGKAVLIAAVTPYLVKTPDNPTGVDPDAFDQMTINLQSDRPQFLTEFTKKFYGVGMLSSPVSEAMLMANVNEAMKASPIATLACVDAFAKTDFRTDMAAFEVPTLIIHGDADQTVPLESSAREAARMILHAQLEIYSGAPHGLHYTHRDRLNEDLAKFVLTPVSQPAQGQAGATPVIV